MRPSTHPSLGAARRFLEVKRNAVVGLSRNEKDLTRQIARALVAAGHEIVPVHPGAAGTLLEGVTAVARLQDVSPPVEAALLFTPPSQTDAVLLDCVAAGVKRVWLHRGAGQGAESPGAAAFCAAHGLEVVRDLCPFMALPGAGFPHGLHAFFRTRFGAGAR
jgi:predicted CoA-binding protein